MESEDFMKAKFLFKQGGVIEENSASSRPKELWRQQGREKPWAESVRWVDGHTF